MKTPARLVQLYPPTADGRTLSQRVHQEWERRQAIARSMEAARQAARTRGDIAMRLTLRGGVS